MKLHVICMIALLSPLGISGDGEKAPDQAKALQSIYQSIAPSVVEVEVVLSQVTTSGVSIDMERRATGLAVVEPGLVLSSASLVEPNGLLATQVESVRVLQSEGKHYSAVFVTRDRATGTAFFRVADPAFDPPVARFAEDDELVVGQLAATLRLAGPSFRFAPLVDVFLVSGELRFPTRCYITSFAASDYLGGPVVALDGRLVGMVSLVPLRPVETGADASLFAGVYGRSNDGAEVVLLPSSKFRQFLKTPLKADAPSATHRPAWLGIETQPVFGELSRALGLSPDARGLLITRVFPDSPAEQAGLRKRDLLMAMNGDPVEGDVDRLAPRFFESIASRTPGEDIEFTRLREGRREAVTVRLAESPRTSEEVESVESLVFGLKARDLVLGDRADLRLHAGTTGARMTTVRPTGFAGLAGLRPGDIVERFDGQSVECARSLVDRLEKVASEKRAELLLFVRRGSETLFVLVQPDWEAGKEVARHP